MKIAITLTTDDGEKTKKEFDNVSEATTYLTNDIHKLVRHKAEAKSKKDDNEQLADREAKKRQE